MKLSFCVWVVCTIIFSLVIVTKGDCETWDGSQDCGECYQYLVIWDSYKRLLCYKQQPQIRTILNQLQSNFPEKVYGEGDYVLELWHNEFWDYFEVENDNKLVANASKINVKEKVHVKEQYVPSPGKSVTMYAKDETALRKKLLENYDRTIWPWLAMGEPCEVETNFMFHKIISVDLSHGSLHMLVWFRLRWRDPRLTWNPDDWNGINMIHFDASEIWNPQMEIWNSEEPIDQNLKDQQIYLDYDGIIFWSRIGQLYISCDMKGLERFPYDNSRCMFEVGSWAYDASRVTLGYHKVGYEIDKSTTGGGYAAFAQYNIKSVEVDVYHYKPFDTYPMNSSTWPSVRYNITLGRQHMQYTFGIILPLGLLTSLSCAAFWLPPSSSERIGYTITIPLAIAVYKLLMYQELPASKELVYSSKFAFGCFLISILVCIETIFVIFLWLREDPYMVSPWRSLKKVYWDFVHSSDWVNIVKAMDVEMTKVRRGQYLGDPRSNLYNKMVGLYCRICSSVASLSKSLSSRRERREDVERGCSNTDEVIYWVYGEHFKKKQSNQLNDDDFAGSQTQTSNNIETGELNEMAQGGLQQLRLRRGHGRFISSREDAKKFLEAVIEYHEKEKGNKFVRHSYNRLIEYYGGNDGGEDRVHDELFYRMGFESNFDFKPHIDNDEKSKLYNGKWQRLSTIVDRISQWTIVPVFVVYVFVVSWEVIWY